MVKGGQKRDSSCADSPDRDSGSAPDHSSIRNKEVKFFMKLLSGAEISCPWSVLERVGIISRDIGNCP